MRRVLATYLHVAPQEVAIAAGRKGKPGGGGRSRHATIAAFINVSHSGSMALVALSKSHEVEADIEQVRGEGFGATSLTNSSRLPSWRPFASSPAPTSGVRSTTAGSARRPT